MSGTTKLEKRRVAPSVPTGLPKLYPVQHVLFHLPARRYPSQTDCRCELTGQPASFNTLKANGAEGYQFKIQVYIDDCQGCKNCVIECPKAALEISPIECEREKGEQANYEFFETCQRCDGNF